MIASNVSHDNQNLQYTYIITVGGFLSKMETRLTRSSLDETQLEEEFQSLRNGKDFLSQFNFKPNQTSEVAIYPLWSH